MAAAPERSWTEEKERTLIAFFSKNSCLWNYKSENYKNRDLRWKTLEHLRILLSFQPPPVPFTVEDIKNKFKNLRTTFQRQYKLVRQSGEAGLVPQWKHYQQLSFLQGCCEPEEGADETPPSPPAEENWLPPTSPGLGISFLHSSSSGGAAGRSFWTEERERELIAFYAEHGCLWNRKSENHNNRQLRQKLLESLRIRLSDQLVLFSVEDVKSKFKNLRTVFNREFKAVQASRTSDQPYVSKWKHFHQMLFLCESFEEDEFPDGPHEGSRTSCSQSGVSASSFDACSIKTESNTISCSAFQGLFPSAPDQTELMDPRAPSGSPPDRKPGRVLVPADDRASGESRCLWSEAKVQQLISFYAEHSCLWNHRVDSFRNRLLRQSLLETLSGLLSAGEPVPFTVEDIKTKFRNLRTIFQREHKAVSANRTCGSEDFYLPKWRHYLDLLFLCDSDNDEAFAQTRPASAQNPAVPLAPTPPRSWLSCSSSSSSSSSSTRSRKRAGRPAAAPRSGRRGEAPHAGFLKYVEECLNEAPPHKVKRMKKKIIETIHNLEEDG
ncbi:uncharacterized protein LOC114149635 [Xiphophorus couchianus]|uniref:uncharacterized protein LOC114149635 n=1 Tax=Xiphophorus couchianus TaxID=32473 RepID=UPI001015F7A8|nr:uncharacterized protein LOC114149635 [Xiphophorus couchianus]